MSKIARFSLHGGTFKSVNMPRQPRGFLPFKGKRFSAFARVFSCTERLWFRQLQACFLLNLSAKALVKLEQLVEQADKEEQSSQGSEIS